MSSFFQLLRTTQQLRTSQILWRLTYRALRRLESTRLYDLSASIEKRVAESPSQLASVATPADLRSSAFAEGIARNLAKGELTLLNQRRALPTGEQWLRMGGQRSERLWKYTFHYHGWLVDLAAGSAADEQRPYLERIEEQLTAWLDNCPLGSPGFQNYAFNSYAIATRLDYWRQLINLLPPDFWLDRAELRDQFQNSMAAQAVYLNGHVEWDLRANHLIRDAVGLASAARALPGRLASDWMEAAKKITRTQLDEQILDDGGHFERSVMYHLEVMRDLLKLSSLLEDDRELVGRIATTWRRMADNVVWLRHPDGSAPQFNDGSLANPDRTLALGSHLGVDSDLADRMGGKILPDTGVVAWRGEPWTLFFNVAQIGPAYQPGHAHADTLSLECSFGQQRLFIDPGTHSYDNDDRRRYDRSTRSHNTVCIDGQDSSEVWHVFRVGRRARPQELLVQSEEQQLTVSASHDGYRHLPGSPRHKRRIVATRSGTLEIVDQIEGAGSHRVESGLLLAPDWTATEVDQGWLLVCGEARLKVTLSGEPSFRRTTATRVVHPDYGIETPTTRLEWRGESQLPVETRVLLEPLAEG